MRAAALALLQGGRAHDVILREDQLLAKAHRLRKKKGGQEELDPFAPEYTDETWHTFQAGGAAEGGACGLCSLLLHGAAFWRCRCWWVVKVPCTG